MSEISAFKNVSPRGAYGAYSGGSSDKERLLKRGRSMSSIVAREAENCERAVLLRLIFHGRIACADGIDILEKRRLIRIDAEVFAKFLVLRSR
jgi:hypothetical protein